MNIFVVDYDPVKAAKSLADKHVVKMILESAQMLCTAHRMIDEDVPEKFYKVTHKNHPCAKWVREAKENYNWLAVHWVALMDEYKYRYDKNHACLKLYPDLLQPPQGLTNYWGSEPPLAMPDEYKTDSVIQSYRNYYREGKAHLHKWTNRKAPEWLQETT
jgi:hypothetical protein